MDLQMLKMDRTERQEELAERWLLVKKGTLVAATGFGKTRVVLSSIRKMLEQNPKSLEKGVLVVVPTLNLVEQWNQYIADYGLSGITVQVINTVIKNLYDVSLLVPDEMHRYASPEFSKLFECVKYDYIHGLTPVIKRQDGMHKLLLQKAPQYAIVSLEECRLNGWVSIFHTFNYVVYFTPSEQELYKRITGTYEWASGSLGFGGYSSFETAKEILKDPNSSPEHKKLAVIFFNAVRKRRNLCNRALNKLSTVKDIVLHPALSDRKSIIYAGDIPSCEQIALSIGNIASAFHGSLSNKQQIKILDDFRSGSCRVLVSCQALNEGVNIPDCSLGIVVSGSSVKREDIQRRGRIVRYQPDKVAVFVNLYIPETQDEKWLNRRTAVRDSHKVSTIDEILKILNL